MELLQFCAKPSGYAQRVSAFVEFYMYMYMCIRCVASTIRPFPIITQYVITWYGIQTSMTIITVSETYIDHIISRFACATGTAQRGLQKIPASVIGIGFYWPHVGVIVVGSSSSPCHEYLAFNFQISYGGMLLAFTAHKLSNRPQIGRYFTCHFTL